MKKMTFKAIAEQNQVEKALVSYAKRNKLKSFQDSQKLFKFALVCENESDAECLNKTFIKMLFSRKEQDLLLNYAKVLCNIAEKSDSNNKFIKSVKSVDAMISKLTELNGDSFVDSVWKQFKHVQMTNTNGTTNKANVRLYYLILIKACYLLKYKQVQMRYITIDELERIKATEKQIRVAERKARKAITDKLNKLSADDLQKLMASIA